MDTEKVLKIIQPMRVVQDVLEAAAMNDEILSPKTLLDLAGKLTAVDLDIMREYNQELTAERDRLAVELSELAWVEHL